MKITIKTVFIFFAILNLMILFTTFVTQPTNYNSWWQYQQNIEEISSAFITYDTLDENTKAYDYYIIEYYN